MSNRRSLIHHTQTVVVLCDWHLRCIFWDERLWEKCFTGDFEIEFNPPRERKDRGGFPEARYNQEFVFKDLNRGGEEVARCHWLLGDDGVTILGSGFPDPKELNWRGINFHKFKGGGACEYCLAGVPTAPTGEEWE